MYLCPISDKEDLKVKRLSNNVNNLQILQNKMIRIVLGFRKKCHGNMEQVRNKIKMISVNQVSIYHTLLEAHNILYNSSSDQIKMKWESDFEKKYCLRSKSKNFQQVPEKPALKCIGFSFNGTKLYHMLPLKT